MKIKKWTRNVKDNEKNGEKRVIDVDRSDVETKAGRVKIET